MSFGANAAYDVTIASFSSLSSAIDLGRTWQSVYLLIPSMTSQSQIFIQASDSATGTFRRVYMDPVNSSTAANNPWSVVSSITNAMVPAPVGLRYLKVETTATISFTAAFRVICSD